MVGGKNEKRSTRIPTHFATLKWPSLQHDQGNDAEQG
jgi:hypothetical protein